jgi:alkylation response protein AidB-like acyl-CoA dehydrogenase
MTMDLRLDDEQNGILDSVRTLFARTAGPQRARTAPDRLDRQTLQRLDEAGFLDVARDGVARDHLAAVLITEQAGRSLVMAPVGARALVAAYVGVDNPPPAIGLALGPRSHVRFGADADAVLMLDQDEVRLLGPDDLKAERVESRLAFPLARVTARPGKGQLLADGSAARMTRAWRTLLAAEAGAAMIGAIDAARQHVSVRMQFGKPIGSLQAVQHRLAEAHVRAQGSMWLARRAAWHLDSELETALAAAYASAAALAVFDSVHQVVGAIGFTREFDLHLWSMRLPVLAAELGGPRAHPAAASAASWLDQRAPAAAG